jgi:outer membrane protein
VFRTEYAENIPSDFTARNEFSKSRMLAELARLQLQSLEDAVRNEVKRALRAVRTSFLQLDVAGRGQAYAAERLRAYLRKNEVGLATIKEVFDVQNDFVAAQANQLRAQAEYAIVLGQFWRTTGELLDREGVQLQEQAPENLYGNFNR